MVPTDQAEICRKTVSELLFKAEIQSAPYRLVDRSLVNYMERALSPSPSSMRFEEQVTVLCAQALAAEDDAKARELLGELRTVLHQHIETLRNGLLAAYPPQVHPASINDALPPLANPTRINAPTPRSHVKAPKKWQQVVHAIAGETDAGTALRLSLELTGLLQLRPETKVQS